MEGDSLHQEGIEVVWQEETGYNVERIENYGPKVVSFSITSGTGRGYVVGVYVPSNYVSVVHWVDQAMVAKMKGLGTILMWDLNIRLEKPRNEREEELAMALANHV